METSVIQNDNAVWFQQREQIGYKPKAKPSGIRVPGIYMKRKNIAIAIPGNNIIFPGSSAAGFLIELVAPLSPSVGWVHFLLYATLININDV
jgi:hypothetical protein